MNLDDAETFICAALRGERPSWPATNAGKFLDRIHERSLYHGVQPLLHEAAISCSDWPEDLRKSLRESAVAVGLWELRHQDIVTRASDALARAGIHAILIKGTAVAYLLYKNSALRTRGDTDLIIEPHQQDEASRVLRGLGFVSDLDDFHDSVCIHSKHTLNSADGTEHVLEVHSRLSMSRVISRLLSYEALLTNAVPVPSLGPSALAHGLVDALFVNCYHRTTHDHIPYFAGGRRYFGRNRLIWLYDIHLLANTFSGRDWRFLIRSAREKGFSAVIYDGLEAAKQCFHAPVPDFVISELSEGAQNEPIARYVKASPIAQQWMDFRDLVGSGEKLRFLSAAVFPSEAYMRSKYPEPIIGWLPWLYARRAFDAAWKIVIKTVSRRYTR